MIISTVINGYEIVKEMNKGGFCDAYKVQKDGKEFFLKVYKDPTFMASDYWDFKKNQKTMIPILKALGGKTETIIEDFEIDGRYYQVKNFIQGETLRHWMVDNGDFHQRFDIAIQLCECVKAVHNKDIIIQDNKPEDIMLVPDTSKIAGVHIVLVDFDWAVPNGKVVRYVGTPGYCNIDGTNLSSKSDIFTLGIVLSELLTGCNPYFFSNNDVEFDSVNARTYEYDKWIEWVKNKDYASPIKLNDELPLEISDIIERCLDPDPNKRPTIDEILFILEKY